MDLLSPLVDFLICLAKWAVGALVSGIVSLVNLLLAALMALLGPLLGLLPTVNLPNLQLPDFLASVNWLFPVDQALIALGLVITVELAWPLVALGLRWLKAVS
jgi:hypothetical protein